MQSVVCVCVEIMYYKRLAPCPKFEFSNSNSNPFAFMRRDVISDKIVFQEILWDTDVCNTFLGQILENRRTEISYISSNAFAFFLGKKRGLGVLSTGISTIRVRLSYHVVYSRGASA